MRASLSLALVMFLIYPPHYTANHPQDQKRDDGGEDVVGDDGYDHVTDDLVLFVLVVMHR